MGQLCKTVLLVIDNFDSFTYNLVQYFGQLGVEQRVFRNNEITPEEALALNPDRVLLSPGPCSPTRGRRHARHHQGLRRQEADLRRLPRAPGGRPVTSGATSSGPAG